MINRPDVPGRGRSARERWGIGCRTGGLDGGRYTPRPMPRTTSRTAATRSSTALDAGTRARRARGAGKPPVKGPGKGAAGGAPGKATAGGRGRGRRALTRAGADKYELYQVAVQEPGADVDFLERIFRKQHGRPPTSLREDFCGTAAVCCNFVARRAANRAVGVDLDLEPLDWGRRHNIAALTEEQQGRVELIRADVLSAAAERSAPFDAVFAMNFSYWVFRTRSVMVKYFRRVREALGPEGMFLLDVVGGSDVFSELTERHRRPGFTYVWEQARFDPLTHEAENYIHFEFPDGTAWRKAFRYDWRVWTLPELRELLAEAGFGRVTFYGEGNDGKGGGNGVFRPATRAAADRCLIAYLVAER